MPSPNKTRKLTTLAMLAASALVLSWLDSLIPVSGVLPGAKLGLANLSVLMGLYLLGPGAGGALCLLKVLLSTFLFGNAFSFFYALAGSVLSYAVMLILKKYCSVVFVSVMGGMFHNLGQLLVAAAIDYFGWMGQEKMSFAWRQWAGLGLMLAGVVLMKWTK